MKNKLRNTDYLLNNMDFLLKKAMRSSETPDAELLQKVKYRLIKDEPILRKSTVKRSFSTAIAAVVALLAITTTAFAAWYFLKPSEVADKFENSALSAAFESESAVNINASVTSGDYKYTLLAIVSGKDITDHPVYGNGKIRDDRTYAVLAIQKTDGSSMPTTQDDEYGNPSFYASPYVKGLKPWQVNAHTMNGGHSETVVDGVMYRILDCDEITMFADRGVYLGANTGSSYNPEAFIFNEQTGELGANPNYDGSSVVFDLPIDKTLANPERAEQYLSSLNKQSDTDKAGDGLDPWSDVDWDKAVPVASTVKELTVESDGVITYIYDFEHGGGTITVDFNTHFTDKNSAQSAIVSAMASDDVMYAIRISIDENGTITGMVVMPE